MGVLFKYRKEVEHELAIAPPMRLLMLDIAEEMVDFAIEHAPVDEGDYQESIHRELVTSKAGFPRERVIADDFKASWIEFGTERGFGPYRILAQAAEGVGLHLDEGKGVGDE